MYPEARVERSKVSTPDRARIWRDLVALFQRDAVNIEAGIYPAPRDYEGGPAELLSRSGAFFRDVPNVFRRRTAKNGQEVFTEEWQGRLPRYYLQNFHYQSGGYLSPDSARLYDTQVEVLFNGTANVMRRQCLVPIAQYLKEHDRRKVTLVDVACGTGRFLRQVREAFPGLRLTGIDLSQAYVEEARRHVGNLGRTRFSVGMAENLPFADASVDIVTTVYLFHELPPKIRREAAREFARILKPGGILVFMDSLQVGDSDDYDGLLALFPVGYHEPYFESYTREDLDEIFGAEGLEPLLQEPVFVSKLAAYRKPV
ncbi:ubiquinone/menaquinone biosynthesis methyltransferase family protein [Lutibaculum baratangense AMV1]|uniref:Ubiquinone/menaquinone biosynthesis methyltransferase family protein n=1 Tax=Lutibaculum baratangense AMV1 TaxID=631454 RepID=V4RNG0_9HYPH|nr:ubiquinone/menaquinone biosynthesis methyltransferase family protein [Lutibaculum baratangense AMV1]